MGKTQVGVIVSDKMQSTAVVEVTLWKIHRIIKKRYKRHNKFMASNPGNTYKTGEMVEIMETRPQSKNKRWEIVRKIEKSTPTAAPTKDAETPKKAKVSKKSKDLKMIPRPKAAGTELSAMISSQKGEISEDHGVIR